MMTKEEFLTTVPEYGGYYWITYQASFMGIGMQFLAYWNGREFLVIKHANSENPSIQSYKLDEVTVEAKAVHYTDYPKPNLDKKL